MHPKLIPYEDLVEQGFLLKSVNEDLILYKYTDRCVWDKNWNEYTRNARGLIFNWKTGQVVAKPFPKFFNIEELVHDEFVQKTITNGTSYEVFEKLDGSLGILYKQNEQWKIATAGSFTSDQAVKATELLNTKYHHCLNKLSDNITLLFEIIYPENKIVVNYHGEQILVLLGAYEISSGIELRFEQLKQFQFPLPIKYYHTIKETIALQKMLSFNEEGFVVRFENGLRIKVKGEEYLRIHRAISNATPLNIWTELVNGRLPIDYKKLIPEEILPQVEEIEFHLTKQYNHILTEIIEDKQKNFNHIGYSEELDNNIRKEIGLYIRNNSSKFQHALAMFPLLVNNKQALEKYIKNQIRPKANILID